MHAEIAGAGLGGLTTATALAQRGWSVRLHELHPEIRFIGAGIYVGENGLRVLEAIGAYDEAVARAHPAYQFEIRNRKNRVVERIHFSFGPGSRLYTIVRRELVEAVVQQASDAGVEIVTDSEVAAASPGGELLLANGRRLQADLVVAADGINPRLRDALHLMRKRVALVDGAIRMLIPRLAAETQTEEGRKYIEYWSGTRRILYTPCGPDQLYLALTALDTDVEAKALPLRKDVWKRSFPHLEDLIDRIGSEGRWDVFEVVTLKRWSVGRLAIVGDAAHAQAPNLGQGRGCAMMNGLGLAVAIEETGGDIDKALEIWEARERPLTEHTQRVSSIWSKVTTWPEFLRSAAFWITDHSSWLGRQQMKTANHIPTGTG